MPVTDGPRFRVAGEIRPIVPTRNKWLLIPVRIGRKWIPLPAGYRRVVANKGSFGAWLRQIRLKKDKKVYLFDGSPKRNQDEQFAVLAISVGHKDLKNRAD